MNIKKEDEKEELVATLVEKMMRGAATFTLSYYLPEDVFHQLLLHRKVRGTLVGYQMDFGKPFHHRPGCQFMAYWDLEMEEWRTFRIVHLVTEGEE